MKRTKLRLCLSIAMILSILSFIWGNSLLPGEDSGELSGFVGQLLQKLLPFLDLESGTCDRVRQRNRQHMYHHIRMCRWYIPFQYM